MSYVVIGGSLLLAALLIREETLQRGPATPWRSAGRIGLIIALVGLAVATMVRS